MMKKFLTHWALLSAAGYVSVGLALRPWAGPIHGVGLVALLLAVLVVHMQWPRRFPDPAFYFTTGAVWCWALTDRPWLVVLGILALYIVGAAIVGAIYGVCEMAARQARRCPKGRTDDR